MSVTRSPLQTDRSGLRELLAQRANPVTDEMVEGLARIASSMEGVVVERETSEGLRDDQRIRSDQLQHALQSD